MAEQKVDYVYDRHRKLEMDRAAHMRKEADRIEKDGEAIQVGEGEGAEERKRAREQLIGRAKQLRNEADILDPPAKGEAHESTAE